MPTNLQVDSYVRTNWVDHIVDTTLPENDPNRVVQEGSRFTASRANNIEDGIYNAHNGLAYLNEENNRIRAEIEMLGRAPVNNGAFLDVLDGTEGRNIKTLNSKGVVQSAMSVGATSITLDVAPFAVGSYVTLYDGVNREDVKVAAMSGAKITVAATTNAYPKGAVVAQSSAVINGEKLAHGAWGTYGVKITEVV